MPGDSMDGIPQIDEHDRGGGNYKDADGDGHITHDEAVGGDHNPVREAALPPQDLEQAECSMASERSRGRLLVLTRGGSRGRRWATTSIRTTR